MPRKGALKFKKFHKKNIKCISAIRIFCCPDTPVTEVITKEPIRITTKHSNSIRRTSRRLVKKIGRLNRTLLCYWPITAKPIQIRMGKGKGNTSYWAGKMLSGTTIVSFSCITTKIANKVLHAAATKVPGRTRILNNLLLSYGRNKLF